MKNKFTEKEFPLKPFPISSKQQGMMIEMIIHYYPEFTSQNYPHFHDNTSLIYFNENLKINWLEILIKRLYPRVFQDSQYWQYKFFDIVFTIGVQHPVDLLYEKFLLTLDNESLTTIIPLDYAVEKEEKKKMKTKVKHEKKVEQESKVEKHKKEATGTLDDLFFE